MSASTNYPTIRPSLLLDFANTEQLDPRITFARSTTATYYDDNTVAKAEENLVLYSQQFDNAYWFKTAATITPDATVAPDGTTTAESLIETATTTEHYISEGNVYMNTVAAPFTFSIYVKANTRSFVYLFNYTANYSRVWFNLSTGAIGTANIEGSAISNASIVSVGNGWYRVSAIFSNIIGNGRIFGLGLATADGVATYLGDGTSGVYIWGAQREARTFITAYTPTTSAPITNYIPVLMTAAINEARLDHNPTTRESLGLLIEESRTNLLTYSEQFDNASWTKSNVTVTANTIVAPDGTLTGDKAVASASTAAHYFRSTNPSSASPVTFSIYAKKSEYGYLGIALYGTANSGVYFNLNTGTIGTQQAPVTSASMTHIGNGWYRCTATYASVAANDFLLWVGNTDGGWSYTGDGYSGIYIWGAQLEAGSFPTSYIPTVASQVTRSADSASMTGSNFSSWYRADEGTVYLEGLTQATQPSAYEAMASFDNTNATDNRMTLVRYPSTNQSSFYVSVGGATQASITSANITNNSTYKMTACYKTNDFALTTNGAAVSSDTSGNIPTVGLLSIGKNNVYGNQYNGTIKRIMYYPARLTNAQLQAITS